MKIFIRSCLAILITSLSLSAIANPCDDGGIGGTGIALSRGIGGTGITAASSGVGGTGITSADAGIGGTGITGTQKGIGGTGIQAQAGIGGTGIVGIITGFGSVCVNGLEVHYYNDTPIDIDGKQVSSQALAIGQVVAVRATGNAQTLVAGSIHAYHQLNGPVTAINVAGSSIKVMGQTVTPNNAAQLKGLQVGQWVEVSGLRSEDGSVLASRIDQTKLQKNAQMVGQLTRSGNNYYLNGTKIEGLTKTVANPAVDTRITGAWNGKSLYVKDMTFGPVSDLLQKVEAFHLQGLASSEVSHGQLNLAGQVVKVTAETNVVGNGENNHLMGKTVIVRGHVREGKPIAQSIELQKIKADRNDKHDAAPAPTQENSSNEAGEKTSSKENNHHESSKPEAKGSDLKHDEKIEKAERSDKIERHEKLEKIDKLDKVEVPDKVEKVELPEKIERVDLPEKIEKVEKVEKIDIVDRIELLEKPY